MISIMANGEDVQYNVVQLVADTEAEVATARTNYLPGSTIFCIDSSEVYMLNSNKEWLKI